MIEAVLFDMDGVLLDSEEFICKSSILMFAEKGLLVSKEDFTPFIGMGENRFLGGVAEKYSFPFDLEKNKKRTYEIYQEITRGKLTPLPGVIEFINKCRNRNLKIAVATSADENESPRRKRTGYLDGFFIFYFAASGGELTHRD